MNFLDSIIEEKKPTSKKPNFLDSIIEEEKPNSKKPNFLDSIIEEEKPKPPTKNFSLLEKLGVEKPKDFNPKEPSFDLEKSFVSGAVGTVDSLGAMFKSLGDDGEIFGNELLANMTSSAGDAIKKVTTPVLDALEVGHNPDAIMELFDSVGCDQYENVESNDGYDAFLWLTALQLDDYTSSFDIEEIK